MLDGRHSGTGGGNHVVIGGATPADSPFLRRPDLLRSLVGYWHNHPSLSYLFSGLFIGPTSQHPRVDEARTDSLYELEIAFSQIPDKGQATIAPWLVDRVFRNLLIDLTGNTHRAEFCIDKLYPPDAAASRLGLVELRAFEMPPHARMSLTQQLLVRALIAQLLEEALPPETRPLGHRAARPLHAAALRRSSIGEDVLDGSARRRLSLSEATGSRRTSNFASRSSAPVTQRGIHLELRHALEPWHVLGEEASGGGTARNVDSSVERLQVKVSGLTDTRYVVALQRPPRAAASHRHARANLWPAFATAPGSRRPACIPTFRCTRRWCSISWTHGRGVRSAAAPIT